MLVLHTVYCPSRAVDIRQQPIDKTASRTWLGSKDCMEEPLIPNRSLEGKTYDFFPLLQNINMGILRQLGNRVLPASKCHCRLHLTAKQWTVGLPCSNSFPPLKACQWASRSGPADNKVPEIMLPLWEGALSFASWHLTTGHFPILFI